MNSLYTAHTGSPTRTKTRRDEIQVGDFIHGTFHNGIISEITSGNGHINFRFAGTERGEAGPADETVTRFTWAA